MTVNRVCVVDHLTTQDYMVLRGLNSAYVHIRNDPIVDGQWTRLASLIIASVRALDTRNTIYDQRHCINNYSVFATASPKSIT